MVTFVDGKNSENLINVFDISAIYNEVCSSLFIMSVEFNGKVGLQLRKSFIETQSPTDLTFEQ